MKLNRKLVMVLALVLSVAMATSGTMAYLSDTDSDVNVMTLGKVEIEQIEQEWNSAKTELKDFSQNKPLYPAVGNVEESDDHATHPRLTAENVVDKYVSVENTGKSEAFVRTVFAFEAGKYNTVEKFEEVIGYTRNNKDWTWGDMIPAVIDGQNYIVVEAVHKNAVLVDQQTAPSLQQVYMTSESDNEHVEGIDGNGNGTYDVLVLSQGIQTAGFDSAATALNVGFGEVNPVNVEKWFGDVVPVNSVTNAAELIAALKEGGTVVLGDDIELTANDMTTGVASIPVAIAITEDTELDLAGHTLTLEDTGSGTNALIFVENADLNITGDGLVEQKGTDDYLLWAKGDSTVNIYGGKYVTAPNDCSVLYASGNVAYDANSPWATINVYGGTFLSGNTTEWQDCNNVMNHGVGRITYYGGSVNWDHYGLIASDYNGKDDANYITIADGYTVTQAGGMYIITKAGNEPNITAVTSNNELDEAIKNGATEIYLNTDDSYIIPDSAQGKTLTFIGTGDTVIATQDDGSYEGCDYSLDGSTVTFENITINTNSANYTGYARMKGTYKNCTINGTYTLYGNSTFIDCTFNVTGDVYNIWTWGAPNATFTNCTFNSDGKALLLYGTENTKLTVNNCTFNDKGGLTDLKAAIEIGNDYDKSYELIVNNTTVNGYEINDKGINTGSTLWGNKNSMGTDKLNVVVDGVDVY